MSRIFITLKSLIFGTDAFPAQNYSRLNQNISLKKYPPRVFCSRSRAGGLPALMGWAFLFAGGGRGAYGLGAGEGVWADRLMGWWEGGFIFGGIL